MNFGLSVINNQYFSIILGTLIALYGANARVELPSFIKDLFKNNIFRVVFLSTMLIYKIDSSPNVAFIIALVFVLTMHYINESEIKENFEYVEAFLN
jgi:hypothetical protein